MKHPLPNEGSLAKAYHWQVCELNQNLERHQVQIAWCFERLVTILAVYSAAALLPKQQAEQSWPLTLHYGQAPYPRTLVQPLLELLRRAHGPIWLATAAAFFEL